MALRSLAYDVDFNNVDIRGITRANRTVDNLDNNLTSVNSRIKAIGKSASNFRLTGLAGGLAGYFGIREMVSETKKFIDVAAKAQDDANVFALSFGTLTEEAREFSRTLSETVGRSFYETENNLGRLQDTLFGFTDGTEEARKQVAGLSETILPFVIDLNSQKDAFRTDAEAMNAFNSGLVGNHEALRKFGVVLTESNLQMKAQQLGLKGNFRDMDALTKLTVRFAEAVDQSRTAVGDAERTKSDYNNQVKTLRGSIYDLRVELGTGLIPIAQDVIKTMIDNKDSIRDFATTFVEFSKVGIKAFGQFMKYVLENPEEVKKMVKGIVGIGLGIKGLGFIITKVIPVVSAIAGVAGSVVFAFQAVAGGAATVGEALLFVAGGPVGLIIGGIVAIIGVGFLLVKNWDKVSIALGNTWKFIKNIFIGGANFVISIVNGIIKAINGVKKFLNDFTGTDFEIDPIIIKYGYEEYKPLLTPEEKETVAQKPGFHTQRIRDIRAGRVNPSDIGRGFEPVGSDVFKLNQPYGQGAINAPFNGNIEININGGNTEEVKRVVDESLEEHYSGLAGQRFGIGGIVR